MILTVEQFREHTTTPLSDEAVQLELDAAEEDILAVAGPALDDYVQTDIQEIITVHGDLLPLSRRANSITEVLEGTTTLAADDYELLAGGDILRRLTSGTHPAYRWRGRAIITYAPYSDSATRARVQIDLVKLALGFKPGLAGYTTGSDSESYQANIPYEDQRTTILASLNPVAEGWIW